MSIKPTRICDVFGSTKGVENYRVVISRTGDTEQGDAFEAELDMCQRALKRLIRFIERGSAPPPPRG